jgi:single-strand DNA-binding protein
MAALSLNKVMLIGHTTRDPILKYTAKNTAIASFGMATNRVWLDQDTREKKEDVEYHNIVAWGKLADICGSLIHKGDKVYVEGRIQTRSWTGEDEVERKTTEVVADNVILLRSTSGNFAGQKESVDDNKKVSKKVSSKVVKKEVAPEEDFDVEDVSDDVPF